MKKKLGIIMGGMSTEHDVSIKSGLSVISYLNTNLYDIHIIYIDKNGNWFCCGDKNFSVDKLNAIDNVFSYLKDFDVIFPVLHGKYGEDGTVQGVLELLHIPYVGCGVLASSLAMDKIYTKTILDKIGICQARYVWVKKMHEEYALVDDKFQDKVDSILSICHNISQKLTYPMYVKPSRSGSSVGVRKVLNDKELCDAIKYASQYDDKIIVEEEVVGREIECSVLGNYEVVASCLGEICPADEFYTYDAKYQNNASKLVIPAHLDKELTKKVQDIAVMAFRAIDGRGLSRVDFFVNDVTGEVYLNEINTMPGFTNISMYPKLWEESGIPYGNLLTQLIDLALER